MEPKKPIDTQTEPVSNVENITHPTPPKKGLSLILLLFLFTIAIGVLALFFENITNVSWMQDIAYTVLGRKNPNILPQPTPTPIPSPTPSYLPSGKQTYAISGSAMRPKVSSLTLDPLDAHFGDRQSLTVVAESSQQLKNVSITLFSDTKKTILPLSLENGIWRTTWTVDDSVNYRYVIRVDATDSATTSSTLIAPRTNGPIRLDELK